MKYKAADTFTICFKHQQRMSLSAAPPLSQCLRSEKKVHFKFEWKFWVKTSWENPQTLF